MLSKGSAEHDKCPFPLAQCDMASCSVSSDNSTGVWVGGGRDNLI